MKLEKIASPRPESKTSGAPAPRWRGAIEGTYKNMLYGWAVDTQQINARVVLEVCLNDEPIGSVAADVARTDLHEQFATLLGQQPEDPCHGFVADLGTLIDQITGTLTVRVANTEVLLDGSVHTAAELLAPTSAISNVFSDGGLKLHGWAIDPLDQKRSLRVRAFLDSEQIAEVIANDEHPALRSYQVGRHGFTLDLPLSLANGERHSVRIINDDGVPLNGSPVIVCCHAGGIGAMLPGSDALLGKVVDIYERYVPRTVGMNHYREWSDRFDADAPQGPVAAGRVGILICGNAGSAAQAQTLASIEAQQGATVQAFAQVGSFSEQLQGALAAGCEFIACVRAGDTLTPHAIAYALQGFNDPASQVVYTDSELNGAPWFKPAWNPEYALGSDYPLELMLARRAVVESLQQSASPALDQASWSWNLLAAVWPKAASAIVHVPRVLYCFGSALSPAEMQARADAAASALRTAEPGAALLPLQDADLAVAKFQPRRVLRKLNKRDRSKTVSLIIPTRDHVELLERCISSLQKYTDWPNLEIIVVDNGSAEAKTKTYFKKIARTGVTILPAPGPFNFAALNNVAVEHASGEIIGLINNDIEARHAGWLDEMVGQLLRPDVAVVGAKLLWPNGMVQHGGVLLGVSNVAGHFGNRLAAGDWGDHGRNQLVQQVSGVTAACLLLRKSDYLAVGGMNETKFPVAFNDVDLCLKLRSTGKAIIWTPFATMLHAESASRGHEDTPQKRARAEREVYNLRQLWGHVLLRDPAYHPSLNLDAHSHAFGGLALPPRPRTPRTASLIPEAPPAAPISTEKRKVATRAKKPKQS